VSSSVIDGTRAQALHPTPPSIALGKKCIRAKSCSILEEPCSANPLAKRGKWPKDMCCPCLARFGRHEAETTLGTPSIQPVSALHELDVIEFERDIAVAHAPFRRLLAKANGPNPPWLCRCHCPTAQSKPETRADKRLLWRHHHFLLLGCFACGERVGPVSQHPAYYTTLQELPQNISRFCVHEHVTGPGAPG